MTLKIAIGLAALLSVVACTQAAFSWPYQSQVVGSRHPPGPPYRRYTTNNRHSKFNVSPLKRHVQPPKRHVPAYRPYRQTYRQHLSAPRPNVHQFRPYVHHHRQNVPRYQRHFRPPFRHHVRPHKQPLPHYRPNYLSFPRPYYNRYIPPKKPLCEGNILCFLNSLKFSVHNKQHIEIFWSIKLIFFGFFFASLLNVII